MFENSTRLELDIRIWRVSDAQKVITKSQKVALKKTNIGADKNRVQWQALVDYFDIKTL